MQRLLELLGPVVQFVYTCCDRLVLHGYLERLQRPESLVYFFHDVVGVACIDPAVLEQRTKAYKAWVRGVTDAQFRARVQSMTGQSDADYTARHAAYDLKKLRGKELIAKMGRSRRYDVSPTSLRAVTALLVLRDHIFHPVLAGVRATQPASPPQLPSALDSHYHRLRLDLQPLFQELGIAA